MSSDNTALDTAADDRRKHPREDVSEPAYISSAGSSTRCLVVNISADGAAIEVPDAAFVRDRFQLMIEKNRAMHTCRVVWIKQNRMGVIFE